MGHPQLTFHQIHVGLDAAKPVIECLQQRALLFVVVVGMSLGQRPHLRRKGVTSQQQAENPAHKDRELHPKTVPQGARGAQSTNW